MFYKKFEFKILLLFSFVLIFCSLLPPIWGYDEYASVITHLELNDLRFKEQYLNYFIKIGFSYKLGVFFTEYLLPVFIVPIRWTYALGISPIYELARIINLDWGQLRLMFLSLHILLAVFGLSLINRVLLNHIKDKMILILFISVIFFSLPFLYWTLTLSPYSFHLFCFGLIVYYEVNYDKGEFSFFSKKSFSRSIVQLFNYQYIPVIAAIGFFDFVTNPVKFFKSKKYKSWVIPFFVSVVTILFLLARGIISNKHVNPSLSVMAFNDEPNKYDLLSQATSINELLIFLFSRIKDIFQYFFQHDSYYVLLSEHYSELSFFSAIIFLCCSIYIIFKLINIKSKLSRLLLIFLFTNLVLYISNIYPFMPSRHSLISFLPLAMLFTLIISNLKLNFKIKNGIIFIIFGFSLFTLAKNYNVTSTPLNKNYLLSTLEEKNIDRLVIKPCDQEPLFYLNELENYKPLYQCGNMIIEILNEEYYRFAVYSKTEINSTEAKIIINPFLVNNGKNYSFKFIEQLKQNLTFDPNNFGNVDHTFTIIEVRKNKHKTELENTSK